MAVRVQAPFVARAQLCDISLGGACLQGLAGAQPGAELQLVLEIPAAPELALAATVVWAAEDRAGVRFEALGAGDVQALREALMKAELRNWLRGSRRPAVGGCREAA